jgi:hypothetical protein
MITPVITKGPNGELSVRGLVFYPLERVEEIFSRAEAARGGPGEAGELLVFYRRMKRLYDGFSAESDYFLDGEEALRMAALGEAAEDAEFVAAITGDRKGRETAE